MHPPHWQRRGSGTQQAIVAIGVIVIAAFVAFIAFTKLPSDNQTRESQSSPSNSRPATPDQQPAQPTGEDGEIAERPPARTTITLDAGQRNVLDAISNERYAEARALVALYQNDRPHCPVCEFLHGLSFHKEKRYELAKPFFEKAIAQEPGYAPSWYFFGWCLYYLGEIDRSRAAFERHLTLDPLEGDSHYALGLIAMDAGDLETAETHFIEAIDLQENNPRRVREVAKAHARLGDAYAQEDRLQEAREQLFLATEIWPDHYEAQFKLARVLYRLGENEAADAAMKRYEAAQARIEGAGIAPSAAPPRMPETPSNEVGP